MSKMMLSVFLLASLSASAADHYEWDNPTKPFDARKKERSEVRVIWRNVSNVREYCSNWNISKGYGPITNPIKACSSHDNNVCIIITGNETSMHTLGHELRHCFQGKWHG